MDIIIIGKKHHNRLLKPTVVYCGQSREEAAAAVAATEGRFGYLFQVNPEPAIPVRTPPPSGRFLEELNARREREAAEAAQAAEQPLAAPTQEPAQDGAAAPNETAETDQEDSAADLTDAPPAGTGTGPQPTLSKAEKKAARKAAKTAS